MVYLLYFITTLIWSSTWIAIKFQLGSVPVIWSVIYRFGIAAIILLAFCWLRGHSLKFSLKQHQAIALQGFLLFSANYLLFYMSAQYFISGLLAVIFASIVIMNIINGYIFLKTPISLKIVSGATLGLVGLCIIFWSDIIKTVQSHLELHHAISGLCLCLGATLVASFGNIVATYNKRRGLPILQTNALGMFYGSLSMVAIAVLFAQKPVIIWQSHYIIALLYLALFGSVFAFGAYVSLLAKIGPERASYSFVAIPLIALIISTAFEGYHWDMESILGIFLILVGNTLVLMPDQLLQKQQLAELYAKK